MTSLRLSSLAFLAPAILTIPLCAMTACVGGVSLGGDGPGTKGQGAEGGAQDGSIDGDPHSDAGNARETSAPLEGGTERDSGVTGCSSGIDAGSTGVACTSSDECGSNEACAYAVSAACAATGECVPKVPQCHCTAPVGCSCNGTPAEIGCFFGLPDGYAVAPFEVATTCGL